MRNELQRHKRSDKVKWVLTGIMFFLAFIMIAGLILQVFGTGKAKPSEWFKKSDSEQTEQLPAEGGENATAHTRIKAMAATLSAENGTNEEDIVSHSSSICTFTEFESHYGANKGSFSFTEYTNAEQKGSFDMTGYDYKGLKMGVPFDISNSKRNENYLHHIDVNSGMRSKGEWYIREADGRLYGRFMIEIFFSGDPVTFSQKTGYYTQSIWHGEFDLTQYENYRLVSSCAGDLGDFCSSKEVYVIQESGVTALGIVFSSVENDGANQILKYPTIWNSRHMQILCDDKPLSLPEEPTKEGYTFDGWYMGTGENCGVDCVAYSGEPITADMQFHAHWRALTYTVTFDSVGGSSVESQTVEYNTAATLTTPTLADNAFIGWFLPDGTQYTNQPIKADTTLTAHWERNVFTVTFDSDGGSTVEVQKIKLNNAITELPNPTRTGYNFAGWVVLDGSGIETYSYAGQPIKRDTTLLAKWTIKKFTVTFYVDGEVYETKEVEYGQSLAKVAETANLKVLSVRMASGAPTTDESGAAIVTEDCIVEAQEMSNTDKVINTVKNNKWAIIGGVAGGIALIAIIAAVCGGVKRKRRR